MLEADPPCGLSNNKPQTRFTERLLGHLRHSGHYVFSLFTEEPCLQQSFTCDLFGDSAAGYAQALDAFYRNGPRPDWDKEPHHPYASSHPLEDWAETWRHYLRIHDTLETAAGYD